MLKAQSDRHSDPVDLICINIRPQDMALGLLQPLLRKGGRMVSGRKIWAVRTKLSCS